MDYKGIGMGNRQPPENCNSSEEKERWKFSRLLFARCRHAPCEQKYPPWADLEERGKVRERRAEWPVCSAGAAVTPLALPSPKDAAVAG